MIKPNKKNELDEQQLKEVNGGFVCGGLCIAGAAFAAGALFGGGIAVGRNSPL
ncbi:MAG: class IIb bacteriocin, lactobin A/cerein 7B family [Pseudobacteriovorax sp.]|nr:class IIb bacteriocin, lactobin A/cerein 7B family [Pseudobacteriovorax sp.]